MTIDPRIASVPEVYRALTSIVNPRPIAWVTTVSASGRVNLAPYSFFNAFGANPPVVVFSPTLRRDGSKKDTLVNIEATGEFVVNAAVESLAEAMNLSSKEIPPDESEIDLTALETRPSDRVGPPRLAASPAALECRLIRILPIGQGPASANLVIGEVVAIQIDDDILGPDGLPDPRKLRTVGRLGRDDFCRTTDIFVLDRPI